jgi:hypothetical protein
MNNAQFQSSYNSFRASPVKPYHELSSQERQKQLADQFYLLQCEQTYQEIKDSLEKITEERLKTWQKHSEEDKKLIDEGRKYRECLDSLSGNSAIDWRDKMQNSFANHLAQKNSSTSQLDHKGLGDRAFQYPIETPSAVSNLDGYRIREDMPVRKLDFNSVAFSTRLV